MYYLTSVTDTQSIDDNAVVVYSNDQVVIWLLAELQPNRARRIEDAGTLTNLATAQLSATRDVVTKTPSISISTPVEAAAAADDKSSAKYGDKQPYYLRTGIRTPVQLNQRAQSFLPTLSVADERELSFIESGLDFLLKEFGLYSNMYFHCTTEVFEDRTQCEFVYYLYHKNNYTAATSLDFTPALRFKKLILLRDYDIPNIPKWYVRGIAQDYGYQVIQTDKQFCIVSDSSSYETDAVDSEGFVAADDYARGDNVNNRVLDLLQLIQDCRFLGKLPSLSPAVEVGLTFADATTGYTPYSAYLFKNRITFNLYTMGEISLMLNELKSSPTWPSIANELTIYRKDLIFAVVYQSYYLPDIARVDATKKFIGVTYSYDGSADPWIHYTDKQVIFTDGVGGGGTSARQTLIQRLAADSYPYLKALSPLLPSEGRATITAAAVATDVKPPSPPTRGQVAAPAA